MIKIRSLPLQPIQKSRFDIDLKTVYKPIHVSIATLKSRDNAALSQGPGEHTDAAASTGLLTGDVPSSRGSHR